MRSVDEIVTEAQKVLESSLREAFAAGQRQVASDLRSKVEALFEGLVEGGLAHSSDDPSEPHSTDHNHHTG